MSKDTRASRVGTGRTWTYLAQGLRAAASLSGPCDQAAGLPGEPSSPGAPVPALVGARERAGLAAAFWAAVVQPPGGDVGAGGDSDRLSRALDRPAGTDDP